MKGSSRTRFLILMGLLAASCVVALWLAERRAQGATFTVTNTSDSGAGSLRQAITSANGTLAIDTIDFNIAGGGVKTINLVSPLPTITAPVIIDGTTQPGWSVGNLVIELNGQNAGALANGLSFSNTLDTTPTSFIRGLAINRFDNAGIATQATNNLTIEGCHIGTDPSGTTARGNTIGILLQSTISGFPSSNITIGGNTTAERNVISGNTFLGIRIFGGSSHHITGNIIGPDKTGMVALGDQGGLDILGFGITVGGTTATLRNVISGNSSRGMTLNGGDNIVQGNYIGVAADGVTPMGNGSTGIMIIGDGLTNNDHTIGGTTAAAKNIIAYNGADGVAIFRDSRPTTGHQILGNSIFSNAGLGIDLDNNGITANDTGDPDSGTNNLQNFPVLASALSNGSTTNVLGQLNSAANTSYRIEFFANSACDPSGNGEGETFLGFVNVTTNSIGNASFNPTLSAATAFGQSVTATATRGAAPFDTSEFSPCVPVTVETFTVTNTNDSGAGSLRQAINDANANANQNLINFNIAAQGVQTIALQSALPTVTQPVIIDGLTQPGASCGSPLIELDGTNAGAGLDGLLLSGGNSTVQGLIINRFSGDGISLITNGGNTVRCNRLGTNAAGNADQGNGGNGLLVSSSSNNRISDNTISGNSLSGIRFVTASNNIVQGNIIGLSADGLTKIGNSSGGIGFFTTGVGNLIGGTTPAARNLISGNSGVGITLRDAGVTNNTIQGNYIGVNATGSGSGFGNTTDGLQILLSSSGNQIGGAAAGEGNLIAFNVNRGVSLISTAGAGNRILGNSIHSNGTPTNFLGLDLGGDGVTANDSGDGDGGPNNLQNFPVIASAETAAGLGTSITGSLNSTAATSFRIEFFTNPACDGLGNGEGETFLGFLDVTTNGSGNASFNVILPTITTVGEALTATATRNAAPFDTSEFSACRTITPFVPPAFVVTNTNDSGAGSLRQAITDANADAILNGITFNIAGAGVKTIAPTSPLPAITQPVIIDGLTQPGATCSLPLIELNGAGAGAGADGLNISAGNCTVQGLIVNRFNGDGIEFNTNGANTVKCSRIGTNQAGLGGLANGANGIFLNNTSDNLIGGTAGDGNLISANTTNGILIDGATGASNNVIQGNLIGVNSAGNVTAGMSNLQDGIHIQGANATNNTIGGTVSGARNVISNNGDDGIETTGSANATTIKGNFIGVTAGGNTDAGNTDRGIIANGTTTIGGATATERNIISANVIGIQTVGTAATTTIQGNYVGLGADGATSLGNDLGVFLNNTNNSFIGGTAPGAGNVISANTGDGISLDGTNNSVQGNLIGTDATGLLDRGNGGTNNTNGGISVGDPNNQIGGPTAAARNVISGNRNGILLLLTSANNTVIKNNLIGTDITGSGNLGNTRHGVLLTSSNNTIGGNPGEGNTIAFNGLNGVGIPQGTGNRVTSNSIFSNGLLGIDLNNDGAVAGNDNLDPDTGGNNLQNYPVITSTTDTGASLTVIGTLNSAANASFRIDFYSNPSCDGSGSGEGQTHLGSTNVTTDGSGNASFNVTLNVSVPDGHRITSTATDGVNNTSEFSACSQPTAIELASFVATSYDDGALLEWHTGFEADNLGFNLYRDENGKRSRVNAQIIAGSALKNAATLESGEKYALWDASPRKDAAYWLEDIDLNGQVTEHGPFYARRAEGRAADHPQAKYLSEISKRMSEGKASSAVEVFARPANPSATTNLYGSQSTLDSNAAIKIAIRREGIYRIALAELVAAGFPNNFEPRNLQLFADGRQVPINLTGTEDGHGAETAAIEFYAVGLDSPFADERLYWLVAGAEPGLRINQIQAAAAPQPTGSLAYTVERRDRTIYFSALRNGESENFFGAVVANNPLDQLIAVPHLDMSATDSATLEVVMQGVTNSPHSLVVQLNGATVGFMNFDRQANVAARFDIPPALLREGDNTVTLETTGDPADVSLVDRIRLTYPRKLTLTGDALCFTAPGGQALSLDGFASKAIRLFDVTDPDRVEELIGAIDEQKGGGYSFSLEVPGPGARRLLALTDATSKKPARLSLDLPSTLRQPNNGADLIIITRRELMSSLEPLKALREGQRLSVAMVDVEDIYDEFNFGNRSPHAVKDFLAYANSTWKKKPRFLLLAGDGSYDPRNHSGAGDTDLVPAKLIDTQLMETASDDWYVDFNNDGLPELAVGRLPARTAKEAGLLVGKLIAYESASPSEELLLVADRNDGFNFEAASESLRPLIPSHLRVNQVYRGRSDDATARRSLLEAINRGQKLVNYAGHASVNVWRGNLLTSEESHSLENGERLSMFVMMNCLNGYFQDVALDSLAESLLKAERGGAVAVWASSAMTYPDQQALMNREFYRQLGNRSLTLGEAAARAKAAVLDPDVRRSWILLGDPTTRIK